jgi:hypothetical protein
LRKGLKRIPEEIARQRERQQYIDRILLRHGPRPENPATERLRDSPPKD